ncbi:porin family protein [Pseudidiomarina homiensis]|uniref:porin family protein n=1 Tax=Pseudidiomarina homiensis TaxID=364198 RepID=UPI00215A4FBA|nr:porin family protein [Pseudidiomarina homiensis]
MKSISSIAKLTLLASTISVPTAFASESPVYDYFSGYYQMIEVDENETGIDAEPDGFGLEFSKQFNDFMYAIASYDNVSGDYTIGAFSFDSDVEILSAGVGFKYSASRATDLFFEPSIVYLDSEFAGDSEDDTGFGAKAGFTHALNPAFHFKGYLRHVNVMDDDTNSYGAEARILFSDAVHGILGAEANSDEKLFRAGVSFRF